MLTRLSIRNFKRFTDVDIPLGNSVVFVGPNNSGKTTALQALALWDLGLRKWRERRESENSQAKLRTAVAINRRDLVSLPVPISKLLWLNLKTHSLGKPLPFSITLEGLSKGEQAWSCAVEFEYANEEVLYCRLPQAANWTPQEKVSILELANEVSVAYLPPMSGLSAVEEKIERGAIDVRLGEGRTADVLRNLCYLVSESNRGAYERLQTRIRSLFGIDILIPEYIASRGSLSLSYRDGDLELDITSAGRGLQQCLLLFAYLALRPGTVLLLDEPDAHLEIIRQREIYHQLYESCRDSNSQLIVATHSEVILDEAARNEGHEVVAFIGRPHPLPAARRNELRQALAEFRFDQYLLAEQKKWVLYLEGSTDLEILIAFAALLDHPVRPYLSNCFLRTIDNQPSQAFRHYMALREAVPSLRGVAIVDRDALEPTTPPIPFHRWTRQEIENFFTTPDLLRAHAVSLFHDMDAQGSLFVPSEAERLAAMNEVMSSLLGSATVENPDDSFWLNQKASEAILGRVLPAFYRKMGVAELTPGKADYHRLVRHLLPEQVSPEIRQVLDMIHLVADAAHREWIAQ